MSFPKDEDVCSMFARYKLEVVTDRWQKWTDLEVNEERGIVSLVNFLLVSVGSEGHSKRHN